MLLFSGGPGGLEFLRYLFGGGPFDPCSFCSLVSFALRPFVCSLLFAQLLGGYQLELTTACECRPEFTGLLGALRGHLGVLEASGEIARHLGQFVAYFTRHGFSAHGDPFPGSISA
ncbi:hypothetical protein [Nocardia callitridis]|uniref:hypothetical protein n=1 Tax=Nocardia callitridis TaxID=648753 RepID=UPI0031E5B396